MWPTTQKQTIINGSVLKLGERESVRRRVRKREGKRKTEREKKSEKGRYSEREIEGD